ncbi:MAG: M20/M25/M40 family metallo-hydrolase [Thermoanaerobaculia bacterium]
MRRSTTLLAGTILLLTRTLWADEPIDWEMVNRIRDEGINRSQVMDTLQYLTDRIGPRLTGSPALVEANEWTLQKLREWGLKNGRLEEWGPFGRGWSFSRSAVHMIQPRQTPLMALPKAWTPGTSGPVRGRAFKVTLETEDDLDQYRGGLQGKVLFVSDSREITAPEQAEFARLSPTELEEMEHFSFPSGRVEKWLEEAREQLQLRRALNDFLIKEGAVAVVDISSRDGGTLRLGSAGSREPGASVGLPTIAMATEQYNWILRLLEEEQDVELEIDIEAQFYDDSLMVYNTIAEIPGTDKADEVVLLGAHLDSWHPGTGSNDNGTGTAVVMEAVRILTALGVRPRRTIRVGLWAGEEQGLLGSRAHVEKHYASRPDSKIPDQQEFPAHLRTLGWPITPKPDHAKLSGYFNLDNGSGKIRGIYTQGNAAVAQVFEEWLKPFRDMGADTVTNRNTGGTDHVAFDAVGLPGFQFIQDDLDYYPRTHHSNWDVFDHARREDLVQASVVMASFAYHAAMRDEMLPRKPLPQRPPEGAMEDDEKD